MQEIKPIKRSPQLQPLSREHHDGLLFVWKIREGLERSTNLETLKEYTIWYWKNHIKAHFFQEEKILLPYFQKFHPLVVRLKEDHEYIRELILRIGHEPVRHDFVQLCNLLETHIRFEEREFFMYLEDHLSQPELSHIAQLLEEKPVSCSETWHDEFWVKQVKA